AAARMVDVQRARDARMAERLATLAGSGKGVLITGNAHADKVRGVPVPLQHLRAEADVVSVGLIEVRAAWTSVPDENWPYDYVWFTPRAKPEDHDYCADMRPAN
ncbi:MAG: ChaN family lipoprotein, partial [Pseudomonadota bacterium]